jgi:hypothetical protein
MKTLSEFKNLLSVGKKIHGVRHKHFMGRNESGAPIFGDMDLGVREISKVQSNSFAIKTEYRDEFVDSWIHFPKASETVINSDGSITFLDPDTDGKLTPAITYKFTS